MHAMLRMPPLLLAPPAETIRFMINASSFVAEAINITHGAASFAIPAFNLASRDPAPSDTGHLRCQRYCPASLKCAINLRLPS